MDRKPPKGNKKRKKGNGSATPPSNNRRFGFEFIGPVINGRLGPPEEAWSVVEMERGAKHKGRKKLLRAPLDIRLPLIANEDAHLRQYTVVYAIDTGTRKIGADQISVSAVVRLDLTPRGDPPHFLQSRPLGVIEFRNATGDETAERLGWALLIAQLEPTLKTGDSVGIVVDHDMEALDDINRRVKPFHQSKLLPQGFTMVYAAADRSSSIANAIVRRCDRQCDLVYERIVNGQPDYPLEVPPHPWCESSRNWEWIDTTDPHADLSEPE